MPPREPSDRQRPDGKTLRVRLRTGPGLDGGGPPDPAYTDPAVRAADEKAERGRWKRILTRPLARCWECGATVSRADIRKRYPDLNLMEEIGEALLPCRSCGGRTHRA